MKTNSLPSVSYFTFTLHTVFCFEYLAAGLLTTITAHIHTHILAFCLQNTADTFLKRTYTFPCNIRIRNFISLIIFLYKIFLNSYLEDF